MPNARGRPDKRDGELWRDRQQNVRDLAQRKAQQKTPGPKFQRRTIRAVIDGDCQYIPLSECGRYIKPPRGAQHVALYLPIDIEHDRPYQLEITDNEQVRPVPGVGAAALYIQVLEPELRAKSDDITGQYQGIIEVPYKTSNTDIVAFYRYQSIPIELKYEADQRSPLRCLNWSATCLFRKYLATLVGDEVVARNASNHDQMLEIVSKATSPKTRDSVAITLPPLHCRPSPFATTSTRRHGGW